MNEYYSTMDKDDTTSPKLPFFFNFSNMEIALQSQYKYTF